MRTDLARLEQTVQRGQAELKADLQRTDRHSVQTVTEIQRGLAQLLTRLDDLGNEARQTQGRIDEMRRLLDAMATRAETAQPVSPPRPATPAPAAPPRPDTGRPPSPSASGPAPPTVPPTASATAPVPRQAAELYQTAYIDYTRGNYNLAIAAFREFIRLHPDTALAEKAQYWIGESYFSVGRGFQGRGELDRAIPEFERAVQEFRRVLINYPRGDRVPAALFKEALSLVELRQPTLAEARLQFLIDQFPSAEEAARARDELARIRKR